MNAKRMFIAALVVMTMVLSACQVGSPKLGPADQLIANASTELAQTQAAQTATQAWDNAVATATAMLSNGSGASPTEVKQAATQAPTQPAPTATITAFPTATRVPPTVSLPVMQTGSTICPQPGDPEDMVRMVIDSAISGNWFHPIYDSVAYQNSNGTNGQWSWANALCLLPSNGGFYKNFEKSDAHFVFRQNEVNAHIAFATLSTSKYASQFLQGANYDIAVNIRTMPGTTISIYDGNGSLLGFQKVSKAGDLTVILLKDGVTMFVMDVTDPAATLETKVWFGPYDRSQNINTFDASKR